MSEAKRTPGPWAAFTDDSENNPHTNIVSFTERTACVFSLPGRHKNEPDVRLIAAAPDLLKALQNAVGALEFSRDYHSDLSNEEQAFAQDRLDEALKAIAKATGESQ